MKKLKNSLNRLSFWVCILGVFSINAQKSVTKQPNISIIFTDDQEYNDLGCYGSDKGPWIETTCAMIPSGKPFIPRNHSGTASPLKGWKLSAWDGESRVPFIACWQRTLKKNRVSDQLLTTMDLLATIAKIAGGDMPKDRTIDGLESVSLLLGEKNIGPLKDYFHYSGYLLTSVRVNQWKQLFPRLANPLGTVWWEKLIDKVDTVELYNLDGDIGEKNNVAEKHPNVVASFMERIEAAREQLGDITSTRKGARFLMKDLEHCGPIKIVLKGNLEKDIV